MKRDERHTVVCREPDGFTAAGVCFILAGRLGDLSEQGREADGAISDDTAVDE